LSGWYLDSEHDARVGRVMCAILVCGLGTLGLVRAGYDAARAELVRRAETTTGAAAP
jgi:hypothetical protein